MLDFQFTRLAYRELIHMVKTIIGRNKTYDTNANALCSNLYWITHSLKMNASVVINPYNSLHDKHFVLNLFKYNINNYGLI